jgi:hypothetical protein
MELSRNSSREIQTHSRSAIDLFMNSSAQCVDSAAPSPRSTRLFVACIMALVAMAVGFIVRAFLLTEWRVTFNLSESQLGSIQGGACFHKR